MANNKEHLAIDHLRIGLKQRAVRGVAFTLAAQGVKLALQFISIIVLSRLLSPSDFGLVAMATVFTGLALKLVDGGLSMATIQRDNVTQGQVSVLFWINSALGVFLCMVGVAVSPIISSIYQQPQLESIMVVMSITFSFVGVSVQHDAILRRQMRFKIISIIEIAALSAGIGAGIVAAVLGLGYWSLVIVPTTTLFMQTVLRWVLAQWRPSFIFRTSGIRPLLGFGLNLSAANFISHFAFNLTPFAVGYLGGAQYLGFFNRATTLTSIPSGQMLPPVLNVLQPALARVANEPIRLRATIFSIMGKLVLLSMLITLTMALLAEWIVKLFFGEGWDFVVPLVQMLALFTIVEPIAGLLAVALVAVGNAKALLYWRVVTFGVLVLSAGIGSIWGPFGVISAYVLSGIFIRLPGFIFYASKFLPVTFRELLHVLIAPSVCAIVTALIIYILKNVFHIENAIYGLMVYSSAAITVYLLLCSGFSATRYEIIELVRLMKMFGKKG